MNICAQAIGSNHSLQRGRIGSNAGIGSRTGYWLKPLTATWPNQQQRGHWLTRHH